MKTHYHPVESPNWGESYKGTHTSYLPYRKYPRDFIGPRPHEFSELWPSACSHPPGVQA
jgi:hypothetical protein